MSFLAHTPVIWTSFALMLVIGAGFSLCRPMVGGAFLDMTSDPEIARTMIATMSGAQRAAHAWVTVLLDTAYPLVYGAFLGGLIFSGGTINAYNFSLTSILVSLVGAVVLLGIVNLFRRGSLR